MSGWSHWPPDSAPPERFSRPHLTEELGLIAVNITAVMRLAHTFAGRLAARGKGGIVLFGSIVGWQGVPGQANYSASKAYVQSLAEGLHDDLKPLGVDVLAVAPGPVDSGFGARAGLAMGSATSPEPSSPPLPSTRWAVGEP